MKNQLPDSPETANEKLYTSCASYFACLAHEFRSPANAVFGFSELALENQELDRETKQFLNLIRSNSHHLLELIDSALDFAQLRSGNLRLTAEEIELEDYLEEIASYCKLLTSKKSIEVQLKMEDSAPETVTADPRRLRQILINLVENAARYTKEGAIRIGAGMEVPDTGDGTEPNDERILQLTVEDTGMGVDMERLERIFRESGNTDPEFLKNFGSQGLGLSISRKLIDLMNGEITFSSEPGQGTCFMVSIPQ